jgi:octaheme c-type cytochrome (tetrathionate reductase family)
MRRIGIKGVLAIGAVVLAAAVGAWVLAGRERSPDPQDRIPGHRSHLDHAAFFPKPLATGQEVTRACLGCHEESAREVMATAHFQWVGDEATDPRTGEAIRIGKKNLINNFCIGIQGNWASCTRCHAGYGWDDDAYDFGNPENVDCLVCHERTGTYRKSEAGIPAKDVDLQAAARSVGYPRRDNCGSCHHYGGGGLGVKHGDLDATLDHPDAQDDVHMGRHDMLCIDCHGGDRHNIRGKAYSVSVHHENGIACTDCHDARPHADARIDDHTARVACQTCHIPSFANRVPTKMVWDWSKAGDDSRPDDVHHYLKIKGEFVYEKGVTPAYHWFDMTVDRYLLGDPIVEDGITDLNPPRGDRKTPGAKIWPFKVHLARQPYDKGTKRLLPPVTAGEGGYWREFDWPKAMALGAKNVGMEFSGEVGFAQTRMHWPLFHMVVPKDQALQCADCHAADGRMDWAALGYDADPMAAGGRVE